MLRAVVGKVTLLPTFEARVPSASASIVSTSPSKGETIVLIWAAAGKVTWLTTLEAGITSTDAFAVAGSITAWTVVAEVPLLTTLETRNRTAASSNSSNGGVAVVRAVVAKVARLATFITRTDYITTTCIVLSAPSITEALFSASIVVDSSSTSIGVRINTSIGKSFPIVSGSRSTSRIGVVLSTGCHDLTGLRKSHIHILAKGCITENTNGALSP